MTSVSEWSHPLLTQVYHYFYKDADKSVSRSKMEQTLQRKIIRLRAKAEKTENFTKKITSARRALLRTDVLHSDVQVRKLMGYAIVAYECAHDFPPELKWCGSSYRELIDFLVDVCPGVLSTTTAEGERPFDQTRDDMLRGHFGNMAKSHKASRLNWQNDSKCKVFCPNHVYSSNADLECHNCYMEKASVADDLIHHGGLNHLERFLH